MKERIRSEQAAVTAAAAAAAELQHARAQASKLADELADLKAALRQRDHQVRAIEKQDIARPL